MVEYKPMAPMDDNCYCRYIIYLCLSSSPANIKSVNRAATYEFRFGENYARMLMMLAMIMMYSFNCPIITPFGKQHIPYSII